MSEEKKIGIYGLIDPISGDVRYIGKSNHIYDRYKRHLREARSDRYNYPVYNWIRKLASLGYSPELVILEECPVDINQSEIDAIARHNELYGELLNVAKGGMDIPCSVMQRRENGKQSVKSRLKNHQSNPERKKLWKLKNLLANTHQASLAKGSYYLAYKARFRMKLLAAQVPHLCGEWSDL